VLEINGHDIKAICSAIDTAKATKEKPTLILCNTVKSCGIKDFEGKHQWHYGGLDETSRDKCKESIIAYHNERRTH
jgi:transketolase